MAGKSNNLAELNDLAQKVSRWRLQWMLQSDPYLSGLQGALENKRDLHLWLNYDAEKFLPTSINHRNSNAILAQRIILLRNGLIFAPVAFTWFSLSQATTGFAKYNATVGNQLVNFLAFWQQPSSYLPSMWTITHTAILDGLIISGIGIVTLLSDYLQGKAKQQMRSMQTDFEISRKELVLAITKVAQPFLVTQPREAVRAVSTTIKSLQSIASRLEKDFSTLQKNSISIESHPKNKIAISKFLNGVMKKFDESQGNS